MPTSIRYLLSFAAAFVLCGLAFLFMTRVSGPLRPISDAISDRLLSYLTSESATAPSRDIAQPVRDVLGTGTTASAAALSFALARSSHGILVRSDPLSHEEPQDLQA